MKHTPTEENYLKAIFHHTTTGVAVATNTIAAVMGTSAASVTDMLKKLSDKSLVHYTPYKGVTLTEKGKKIAVNIVRKHRLWEVFLVKKLAFSWDNVHEVAEQLEHVESEELIRKLDAFLEYPAFDPHGDPIPNEAGDIVSHSASTLDKVELGKPYTLVGVLFTDSAFLQYLDKLQIGIGVSIKVVEKLAFDDSYQVEVNQKSMIISGKVAESLLVEG